ncbi:MAG TPA: hypothetical protein VEY50_05815 [Lysobacter sp.]|nr:hypothetical protein [Lysobacter sp.]
MSAAIRSAVAPRGAASALQTGDVLLMMGRGPLSALIAWCGDSVYSHAALVADRGELIEAAAEGVRRYPLAQRLADGDNYCFIDAFRPLAGDGSTLTDADRARVLAHAQSLLGVPYPLDRLATLGVLVAVRGKWPSHWLARLAVREALDHLVRDDPAHMVCSEVVYRSFAECDAQPRGRLAPRIVLQPRGTAPFPKIDWKALWEEIWPLLRRERRRALAAMARAPDGADATGEPAFVSDEELAAHVAELRAALGLSAEGPGAVPAMDGAALPVPVADPNPKLVTPLDLASTPSHVPLGRLLQAADAAAPA